MDSPRLGPRALAGVALRPWLWRDAAGLALDLASRKWWTRTPPLPLPDPRYVAWRLQTAYGGDGTATPADESRDLVSLVSYRRELRRSA
ncbi:MAG: hypothetical protein U0U69_10810 [Acidimicrobiia bacterium]